jgi:hypothetical protein
VCALENRDGVDTPMHRPNTMPNVGSYGTRNIVVIGMMVLGATYRLIVLSLSKF